jgi:GrpB-like predicted nucleotidyltransferase (UPF0157 family)
LSCAPYNPRWQGEFERLRDRALSVVGVSRSVWSCETRMMSLRRWPAWQRLATSSAVAAANVHRDRVAFRDYLRTHPQQAQRYVELKKRAAEVQGDWDRYTQLKHEFIRQGIRAWRARP